MGKLEIESSTFFFKEKTPGAEWFWHTEVPNGEKVAVGGEGYRNLSGAVNGFLSSAGHPDWKPGDDIPYPFTNKFKVNPQMYRIDKYKEKNA